MADDVASSVSTFELVMQTLRRLRKDENQVAGEFGTK